MIDANVTPTQYEYTVTHAPAGSSVSQIINHYWREMCKRNGIDPDNPPPSTHRNDEIIVCQAGPHGTFQAVAYKRRPHIFFDPHFLDSVEEGALEEPIDAYTINVAEIDDKEDLKNSILLVLNQMQSDMIDVPVISGLGQDEALIAECIRDALQSENFMFSLVIFTASEEFCAKIRNICGHQLHVTPKNPYHIVRAGLAQGHKFALVELKK